MTGPVADRRALLRLAGAAALALAPLPAAAADPVRRIAGLLPAPGAAALGRAWLAARPEEAAPGLLLDRIAGPGGGAALAGLDGAGLRAALGARIRADLAAGRVVSVAGWLLAPTEARLLAAAALVAEAPA